MTIVKDKCTKKIKDMALSKTKTDKEKKLMRKISESKRSGAGVSWCDGSLVAKRNVCSTPL